MGSVTLKFTNRMLSKLYLIAFLFQLHYSSAVVTRRHTTEIIPHANTDWGTWGPPDYCPVDSFAQGFQLKVEWDSFKQRPRMDDTALNAIKLYCTYADGRSAGSVESYVGPYGHWGETTSCDGNGNWLAEAQFKSEPPSSWDDTAGNNLNMACLDGEVRNGNGEHWGEWSGWVGCPSGTAVCGLKNKVEFECFKAEEPEPRCDDTAHNAVVFYYCDLPSNTK